MLVVDSHLRTRVGGGVGMNDCAGVGVQARERDTYNSGRGIHVATQRVDGDDMRCLLVPGPIFLPIARRDFFPRVVEVDGLLKVLHRVVVCR